MANYVTIKISPLYNNSGARMETWPANQPFSTGEWVKDGRLYLGPNLANRWIDVGNYRVIEAPPPTTDPPPPATVDSIINIRKSRDGGVTWYESKYYEEIPSE